MNRILPLIALFTITSAGAQTVQKCCGTSNSTFLLGNLSTASHSQCLYTPTDLANATDGDITRIHYRYGTTGETDGNTLTNFMVRMTQTPATAFAGGNTFFTGLDTVLTSASYTIAAGTTGEWFVIELDSTFSFDASLTLVVDISFTGSLTTNFGTLSTNLAGRKLYWNDLVSPTGQSVVTTWQDIGFDLAPNTSVHEAVASFGTQVFPNPATDRLLVVNGASNTLFRLFANDGRLLLEGPWQVDGLDVSGLEPGAYVLSLANSKGWHHHRFMRE